MNVQLLNEYADAKDALTAAKKLELDLRLKITDELLKGKEPGTHNYHKEGYTIKVTQRLNYKVDEDELDLIWEDLSVEEQSLIRFKPSIKVKEYKEFSEELVINNAITVTPGMPTLSISLDDE